MRFNKEYKLTRIGNWDILAKWMNLDDCLSLEAVWNINGEAIETEGAIPHGLKEKGWNEPVDDLYIDAAIATIENWIKSPSAEFENSPVHNGMVRIRSIARGWFYVPIEPSRIQDVNIVDSYCRTILIHHILNKRSPDWFTHAQRKAFENACDRYLEENQDYFDRKASEFASYWRNQIGNSGSSGDAQIDFYRAGFGLIPENDAQAADLEKFEIAVKNWALAEFASGQVPFLDTDYDISAEIRSILADTNLMHLAKLFPWKTWMHLDFSDRPTFTI